MVPPHVEPGRSSAAAAITTPTRVSSARPTTYLSNSDTSTSIHRLSSSTSSIVPPTLSFDHSEIPQQDSNSRSSSVDQHSQGHTLSVLAPHTSSSSRSDSGTEENEHQENVEDANGGQAAFLTRRLKSAIGQKIVSGTDDSQHVDTFLCEDNNERSSPHETYPRSTEIQGSGQESGDHHVPVAEATPKSVWDWKNWTTNLPTTWKIDRNIPGVSRILSSNQSNPPEQESDASQDNLKRHEDTSNNEATHSDVAQDTPIKESSPSTYSSYIQSLDVRKWVPPLGGQSTTSSNSQNKKSSMPPFQALGAGSFPTSSVARHKQKSTQRQASEANTTPANRPEKIEEIAVHEIDMARLGYTNGDENATRYPEHEFLVLSTAGKPIFASNITKARLQRAALNRDRKRKKYAQEDLPAEEADEEEHYANAEQQIQDEEDQTVATRVGLMQAVISNYAESGKDKLQSMARDLLQLPPAGRVCFLLKPPLYLAAIAQWDEAETTLSSHLEYLYLAIVSLLSASKLHRLFDRAANFDLKRLLQGTDAIIDALLTSLQRDTTAMRGTLQPLCFDAAMRHDAGATLIPSRNKAHRPQDALYGLLLTRHGLVTVARASKHSIHPIDCQLLINTVFATKALKEGGTQSWVPICLPKFAPQGFVYAHVSFLDEEADAMQEAGHSASTHDTSSVHDGKGKQRENSRNKPELGLVLVTGNPDGFEEMSQWRSRIVQKLSSGALLARIWENVKHSHVLLGNHQSLGTHSTMYSADELGIAGLRHFCFKWRSNVQSTSPVFERPYEEGSEAHRRLLHLYGLAHQFAMRSSGRETEQANVVIETETPTRPSTPPIVPQSVLPKPKSSKRPSSIHVVKTSVEAVLAWNTEPFEMAIAASPHIPPVILKKMARDVVKWVKQQEHRLFIVSAPVF